MQTTITRVQQVFGAFSTACMLVALLIASSDFLAPRTPSAKVVVGNVQVVRGRPNYHSNKISEFAICRFSLDADLSSLMTWNTKEVFVYVSAVWNSTGSSGSANENEAVIWDSIITSPSADYLSNLAPSALKKLKKGSEGLSIDPSRGILKLKNQKPKYQITSPTGKLAETANVELQVHYNVQPWVGLLTWSPGWQIGRWKVMKGGVSKRFDLPPLKQKKEGDGAAKETVKTRSSGA